VLRTCPDGNTATLGRTGLVCQCGNRRRPCGLILQAPRAGAGSSPSYFGRAYPAPGYQSRRRGEVRTLAAPPLAFLGNTLLEHYPARIQWIPKGMSEIAGGEPGSVSRTSQIRHRTDRIGLRAATVASDLPRAAYLGEN